MFRICLNFAVSCILLRKIMVHLIKNVHAPKEEVKEFHVNDNFQWCDLNVLHFNWQLLCIDLQVYLTVVNPLIFQWAYGILVATLVIRTGMACR